MKKWLIGLGVAIFIGLVIWFLFEKQITSTFIYYNVTTRVTGDDLNDVPNQYTLQKTDDVEVKDFISEGLITVPVLFDTAGKEVEGGAFTDPEINKLIWISESETSLVDGVLNGFSAEEVEGMCAAFAEASEVTACDSEFDFYRAIMNTKPQQTHWYSSTRQKVGMAILLPLKKSFGIPQKEFVGSNVSGFMSETSSTTASALVFTDDNSGWYQITFGGYSQAEIDYTLENIVVEE